MTTQNSLHLDGRSVSVWPTTWKYALIIAAFSVAWGLITRATPLGGTPGVGLVGFVVTVVLLVLALRSFRRAQDGYMTFGQGFTIAFVASVVANLVGAAVGSIYLSMLGEEQLAAQREAAMSQIAANPAIDAQTMEMMRGFFDAVFTPAGLFVSAAIVGTITWCVVSLILAAVLKKSPPIRS